MSERVYRVVVTREGDAWLADVPDVPGAHTWAKNLPGLDRAVREVIALVKDLPDGAEPGLRLAYDYDVGDPDLNVATAALRSQRERLQQEGNQLAGRTAELVAQLAERSMSVRDAAALVGISPQRVSQINAAAKQPTKVTKRVVPAKRRSKPNAA